MFHKKLRELRKAKKITQSQLGKELGISASTVGMYEQGRRFPDAETIKKITAFFNVSSDYMYGKERIDVATALDEFKAQISLDKTLMFNGVPLSNEDAQRVLTAMELCARLMLENDDKGIY